MKKLMTMALAGAFMFAMAGQVQAAALETKGQFRARYWSLSDYFQTINPAAGDSTDFWDQRLRLFLTWPVADGVKVEARADVLEQFWGASSTFVNDKFFTTNNQIDFDWLNVSFAMPGTPLAFQVGKQTVSWGTNAITAADNRYRFKVTGKFDPVTVVYAWDKSVETLHGATITDGSFNTNTDDADGYTLAAISTVAGFKLGGYVSYTDDHTKLDAAKSDIHSKRVWTNVFTTGKAGIADIAAEVGYKFGEDTKAGTDAKFSGLAAYLSAKAPVGPASLGFELAYAAGDKPDTKKNEGDLKFDYDGPFSSVILFNNFDLPGWSSNRGTDFSVENAIAAKLSGSMKVMPALTLYGAAVYATRDKVASGVKKDMGTEFDLIAMYSVTENVGINVGAGYLIAGDNFGKNVDNPWGATVHFNVNF